MSLEGRGIIDADLRDNDNTIDFLAYWEGQVEDDSWAPAHLWHHRHGGDLEARRTKLLDFLPRDHCTKASLPLVLNILFK